MIYTLEKRHEFDAGRMFTYYELRQYDGISEHTGALLDGKTVVKFKSVKVAKEYCKLRGIEFEKI